MHRVPLRLSCGRLFPLCTPKDMKISEIRKKFLRWAVPFAVGKMVIVPIYRRVSTTHDIKNSGYKQSWEPGKARVTSVYCEKKRGQAYFSIFVNRNACAVKWISGFKSDGFFVEEKERGTKFIDVGPDLCYASANEDLFTKTWAQKLCDRLNAIEEAKSKKTKKIIPPKPKLLIEAKPCKCKACKCGKAKARKAK